jgi:hypothetical protein
MSNEAYYQNLCHSLLNADSEDEVVSILKNEEAWHNSNVWRPFGDNENNWSAIGNQQGNPISALVEKMVNSIDAVLLSECWKRDIHPESNQAPSSIQDALAEFFQIPHGNLANITASERSELAQRIGFIATGERQSPCFTVFDTGEGQSPQSMPETLLSLSKSNKLRIPFVQGKFNMGGTGVLPYCGKHNLQLIISRKHPDVAKHISNDDTLQEWGFTIVRREPPSGGRRSSMFTYFAPERRIMSFYADRMELPETGYGTQVLPYLEWGTIIKLYSYELSLKSIITNNLARAVARMLPRPSLPIRFYEKRDYSGHSLETNMNGLYVRLQEDKSNNVEDGFPTSHPLMVRGQKMKAEIFVFKKGQHTTYKQGEGVLFVINGQTHGVINQRFFSTKKVNMGYIADEMLILVDASEIDGRAREDLFMNSRDRLRTGDLYDAIRAELETLIRTHQGLRELKERRRREAISEKLSDEKPLQDVLNDIMKKSPSLSSLFIKGQDIGNPLKSKQVGEQEKYVGRKYPTYFKIVDKDIYKEAELGRRFRVQFETDAVNDYFSRDTDVGEFLLYEGASEARNYHVNLVNGVATLNVDLPENIDVGDTVSYMCRVTDSSRIDPFVNEFVRLVIPEVIKDSGTSGSRKPPKDQNKGNRETKDTLELPHVEEIREDSWEEHHFDKHSALKVINVEESIFDFYINMDNVYLQAEIKNLKKNDDPKLLEAQFKYAMVLIGLGLLNDYAKSDDEDDEETIPIADIVMQTTRAIAPVIIPMIDALGDLTSDDIS